jgi:O-antigen/teichoic acid export membrane protein
MHNNSIKNFSFISIGRTSATVLQAMFFLIFASLLDPEIYGELNVIVALAGTFAGISRLGLDKTLQIYQAKKSELYKEINTLFVILAAVSALILLFIDPLASFLSIGMSFFAMNLQNLLGLKKYKSFMFSSILKSSTFIIIPLILYSILEIPGIILGMAISHFIASFDYFSKLRLHKISNLRNNFGVILHNFGVDSGANLSFMVDKLLIAELFDLYVVGIYQFNLQIFLALGVLPNILMSYLLTEESNGNSHRKLSKFVILTSVIITIIVIISAPFGVEYIFPKYVEGVLALQIIVLSLVPASFQAILNAKLMSKESTRVGYSSIVRITSFLILIAVLGKEFGLVGLSLAVLISITLNTIFLYWLSKKKL